MERKIKLIDQEVTKLGLPEKQRVKAVKVVETAFRKLTAHKIQSPKIAVLKADLREEYKRWKLEHEKSLRDMLKQLMIYGPKLLHKRHEGYYNRVVNSLDQEQSRILRGALQNRLELMSQVQPPNLTRKSSKDRDQIFRVMARELEEVLGIEYSPRKDSPINQIAYLVWGLVYDSSLPRQTLSRIIAPK